MSGEKIYGASKVRHAARWRDLRAQGWAVISTWIDEAGPGETRCRAELAERCVREVSECDVLILYCEPGDVLKGALVEAGAALALDKPVLCVGTCANVSTVFEAHPKWRTFDAMEVALRWLREAAAR